MGGKEILILSTHGGIRNADGTPIALGYHTGHWEVGLLMQAAAEELKSLGAVPFAAATAPILATAAPRAPPACSTACPIATTPPRVFRRLIRSLPTRRGVIGVATCDKGLPAMMMALAAMHDLPCVLVPGGVTLLAEEGEDAGRVQSVGARFAHEQMTLEDAAENLCRACATPGGGCQFLGTAATSQVVGEALGMALTHSALVAFGPAYLARSGAPLGPRRPCARIARHHHAAHPHRRLRTQRHDGPRGFRRLDQPHPASARDRPRRRSEAPNCRGLDRRESQGAAPGRRAAQRPPLPPHGAGFPRRRRAGGHAAPAPCRPARTQRPHRQRRNPRPHARLVGDSRSAAPSCAHVLRDRDGVDPDDVIMDPAGATKRGLTSTVTFPRGNLAPGGSVIKSTAIDPSVVDADGVYRKLGPARVFRTETAAIAAIKSHGPDRIQARRHRRADLPRTHGLRAWRKSSRSPPRSRYLDFGKHIAVLTDARFSGVSTGACIGHVTPEALAGGPIGKVLDGDMIEIIIDRVNLEGSVDLVGAGGRIFGEDEGTRVLAERPPRPDLAPDPQLPDDSRLWAALQNASGGTWGGCVFDVDAIIKRLS